MSTWGEEEGESGGGGWRRQKGTHVVTALGQFRGGVHDQTFSACKREGQ